jgi:hypothetical protein
MIAGPVIAAEVVRNTDTADARVYEYVWRRSAD